MSSITLNGFSGGISNNTKSGLPNACRISRNLDIYSDSDSIQLNPIPIKDSGSIVTDLVKWMVDANPYDTNRYALGDTGNLYKITSGGTWSVDRSGVTIGHSGTGQGMELYKDYVYYATFDRIGRKGPLSNASPSFNDDFFFANSYILDQFNDVGSSTYTTPVAISETATELQSFTPTRDPIIQIQVWITAKGTGNVTLTLHDSLNNLLGNAITITNANLNNGSWNVFTFNTPVRAIIGNTYHFHMTSTVADATVRTINLNDLSTSAYFEYCDVLIGDTQFHPMMQHTNGITGTLIIGNADYLAQWDGNNYNPNQITIEPGYNVRALVKDNEFLVALAWKGTNIDSFEKGYAFYWDGVSPYYNYSKPITGGSPNAAVNFKNRILSVLGSSGDLYMYTDPFRKIQPLPKLVEGKKIEVLPGAMTLWQTRAHIGFGVNATDSTGLEQGVYEFGNQSDRKVSFQDVSTEVLNYGYQISTGDTQGTTMKIGCVFGVGKDMYISWKSQSSSYGVDKVTKGNNPAATGSWESLITDVSADAQGNLYPAPQKTKLANKLVITFAALASGCTVTPKYKLDRAAAFTLGTQVTSSSAVTNIAELPINTRYREAEYGFNCTATTNNLNITGIYWLFDPLLAERQEN